MKNYIHYGNMELVQELEATNRTTFKNLMEYTDKLMELEHHTAVPFPNSEQNQAYNNAIELAKQYIYPLIQSLNE